MPSRLGKLRCLWLPIAAAAACAAPEPRAQPDTCVLGLGAEPMTAFEFADPGCWRQVEDAREGPCLELVEGSKYAPPHRSPTGIAVLRGVAVGDFELELRLRQTGREYPHRDLCVLFAVRDAAHFAYAHLASAADANAHHLMLVDGADRRPITTTRTNGVAWGDGWHRVRLRRHAGRVAVWFDDAPEPVLTGEAPTWAGGIGFGSFDDSGRFSALRLAGVRAPDRHGDLFARPR